MTGSLSRPPERTDMGQSAVLERILHDFKSVASQLPDGVISHEARQRAAVELTRLGWPSARDEHWRYANLRAFERVAQFRPPTAVSSESPTLPAPLPGFERLLFVDGRRSLIGSSSVASAAAAVWPAEQRLGLLCDMFASDVRWLDHYGFSAFAVPNPASGLS